jgi:hypothetical protein
MIIRPDAFILDTDGTVCSHEGIRGHFEYEKVSLDVPIQDIIDLACMLSRNLLPIVVSGRMDIGDCRPDTVQWYRDHFPAWFCDDMLLFMRPPKLPDGKPDYRPDYVVKEEIYNRYLHHRFNIRYAIDDRLQVCRKWHAMGLTVLRVGDPDAVF